ncbi:MAG: polymer-forming cytoskeletal protein [Gammaproteobacteria bacterium]|nr:polymer-forming cytoskeletal protein [Gammaproteobacteria bacterium]MCW5583845.1 polymer-forming cytoskeletal protein [Gammaproteobacteria bacterium]
MSLDNASPSHSSQDETLPVLSNDANREPPVIQSSVIGKAMLIKGDISAREDMVINGRLEGTVALKSNKLVIGADGQIEANAFAKVIIVSGELKGDVYASEQVIVTATGRVIGDIYTADVKIEDGALIDGNIDMQNQDIFKQHAVPEIHDDGHSKATGLGFLFKKNRELPHTDVDSHKDIPSSTNLSKELFSSVDDKKSELSVIGESVMVKGEIISGGNAIIYGEIDGVIYFKNNGVGIGEYSRVKATVFAKSIVVHGQIRGNIYASEKVIIKNPGDVCGEIHAPRVSTENGAVIMGKIKMEPQDIEQMYSNMLGISADKEAKQNKEVSSGDVLSGDTVRVLKEHTESIKSAIQPKDSSWPIFYPRS